jgi:hypothetical protein
MPTFSLLSRERVRERERARPVGTGSEIVQQQYNSILIILMNPTPQAYTHSRAYTLFFPHAVGTYDAPAVPFPFIRKIKETRPEEANYMPVGAPQPVLAFVEAVLGKWAFSGAVVFPMITFSPFVPSNSQNVISYPAPATAGGADVFYPTTNPSRIYDHTLPIRRVTILAASDNVGNIWVGYSPTLVKGRAFPLEPGAARDFDIDDLSKLYMVAENNLDKVYYIYER